MMRRTRLLPLKVVIVESPNKVEKLNTICNGLSKKASGLGFQAKKLQSISKEQGELVRVAATVGHFMEKGNILYSTAEDGSIQYTAEWVLKKPYNHPKYGKTPNPFTKVLKMIHDNGKSVSEVIIATDPDREGELIGHHVLTQLQQDKIFKKLKIPTSRAYFHAITEDGIEKGLSERKINFTDLDLVRAAETRHSMDRTFGYLGSSVSRAWNKNLRSVGRVQTPSLILIHEREQAIKKHLDEQVLKYSVRGDVDLLSSDAALKFASCGFTIDDADVFDSLEEAEKIVGGVNLTDTKQVNATIAKASKVTKRSTEPPQPFTMPGLISAANRQLGHSSDEVAKGLQELFSKGFITYPRTDSTRIDPQFEENLANYLGEKYGASKLQKNCCDSGGKKKKAKKKSKKEKEGNVEDAHEAIRPTSLHDKTSSAPSHWASLYSLIYTTTCASLMIPKETETVSVGLSCKGDNGANVSFRISASRIVDPGFSVALNESTPASEENEESEDGTGEASEAAFETLKSLSGEPAVRFHNVSSREKKTKPPSYFNEGTLIAELKKHGVGRPSTYPNIISTLRNRQYIDKSTKKLHCTESGQQLCQLAQTVFPAIVDIKFTSKFEEELDSIAQGNKTANEVLSELDTSIYAMISKAVMNSRKDEGIEVPEFDGDRANAKSFQAVQNRLDAYLSKWRK